jgi:hypothetical protein
MLFSSLVKPKSGQLQNRTRGRKSIRRRKRWRPGPAQDLQASGHFIYNYQACSEVTTDDEKLLDNIDSAARRAEHPRRPRRSPTGPIDGQDIEPGKSLRGKFREEAQTPTASHQETRPTHVTT